MPQAAGGDTAFVRRVLIVAAIAALALLAWHLVDVLLLVFGAVLIAVLLRALADPIARRTPLSDTWALVPATLGILVVIGLVAWLFGAEVRAQVAELAERLPDAWRSFQEPGRDGSRRAHRQPRAGGGSRQRGLGPCGAW